MNTQVYAVYTSKGGSGKTTSAVHLAWTSALLGVPTLLWDLDAQGAASYFLRHETGTEVSARKLLAGKRDWVSEVRPTAIGNLALIPCDQSFRHWDTMLQEQGHARKLLSDWLKPLRQQFGVIFLDCPPGLTLLSEALFRAADTLVVPVVPSALGFRTWEQVRGFVSELDRHPPLLAPFLSMVDRRKGTHRQLLEAPPPGFLRASVPLLADIERTLDQSQTRMWRRSRQVSELYGALWHEILTIS
ncbi:MAG: AAA family ATPase [Spirochaetales bacterium]